MLRPQLIVQQQKPSSTGGAKRKPTKGGTKSGRKRVFPMASNVAAMDESKEIQDSPGGFDHGEDGLEGLHEDPVPEKGAKMQRRSRKSRSISISNA